MLYQSIATVIAGLLIAGAIVFSRPSYSFISMPAGALIKMDNRTGEMTVCAIREGVQGSQVKFFKMQCKVLEAEYP